MIVKNSKIVVLIVVGFFATHLGSAQEIKKDSVGPVSVKYGPKGFEFRTNDGKHLLHIQTRLQFRVATPNDQDPITLDDFSDDRSTVFKINRARLKVGGHAFEEWLKYYWEYELSGSKILDFRVMIEKWEWLNLKVGQWKVEFSNERRISSGEQEMVERSIINRPFTLDRQQGMELYGHLDGKGPLDFSYWAAILTGTGRGSTVNDDKNLMYFGRLQWNFWGEPLKFEGSDLEIHETPSAFVAFAAVTNRSPYTRFSAAGGGSLYGYEDGEAGQYRVNQTNWETAFKYRGFSWQTEFHHKQIIDKVDNDQSSKISGYYLQAGYLFHQSFEWWPKKLEMAFRYANYDPNLIIDEHEHEKTLAFNWFFKEHKNKLTFEVSHFDYLQVDTGLNSEWRFRIQWDISL
ncbi:OprO/OprP family phosphate-selective porin [Gelidibacter mesophilus]|uniref:OprO/OprP family phosphate-selective porin n=1 Tax=Gelidibacter mesophilus TaxID=169050 RepID=UPI00040B6B86|nr:porin [Gelidibacter mesophilus]